MKGVLEGFSKSSWAIFPDPIWLIYNPNFISSHTNCMPNIIAIGEAL